MIYIHTYTSIYLRVVSAMQMQICRTDTAQRCQAWPLHTVFQCRVSVAFIVLMPHRCGCTHPTFSTLDYTHVYCHNVQALFLLLSLKHPIVTSPLLSLVPLMLVISALRKHGLTILLLAHVAEQGGSRGQFKTQSKVQVH